MIKLLNRKDKLHLSDKQPLTVLGMIGVIIMYTILIAWSWGIIWPLSQMVMSAFNGRQGTRLMTNDNFVFSTKHYEHLFQETLYLRWVVNTIFIAGMTAIVTVIFTSFTSYAYSRFRFTGRKQSLMTVMLVQTIPAFTAIPVFYTLHTVVASVAPWFSRQMMLILIYSGGAIAMNTFVMKMYLDSVSTELDDAARIDGCSNMKVYRLILMPIAKPMLALIGLWSFIGPFADYLLPAVLLRSRADYTLAAGLFTLISDERTINQPAFAAGGLLTAIPIAILFIVLNKQLVSGLASGAVKG
ncbi:sugar ABC transporter permease [Spirochaeta dissipatitropha]